jgi:hypothetical protein
MNAQEIRAFRVDLLDGIHELATEPVADAEEVRRKVNEFFDRLERETDGEER